MTPKIDLKCLHCEFVATLDSIDDGFKVQLAQAHICEGASERFYGRLWTIEQREAESQEPEPSFGTPGHVTA